MRLFFVGVSCTCVFSPYIRTCRFSKASDTASTYNRDLGGFNEMKLVCDVTDCSCMYVFFTHQLWFFSIHSDDSVLVAGRQQVADPILVYRELLLAPGILV
jgi:hypothetical protein